MFSPKRLYHWRSRGRILGSGHGDGPDSATLDPDEADALDRSASSVHPNSTMFQILSNTLILELIYLQVSMLLYVI
jgi:hypothetical protein